MAGKIDEATAITAAGIFAASPVLGDYAIIVGASTIGALIALSRVQRKGWDSLRFFASAVGISVAISGFLASLLSSFLDAHQVTVQPYQVLSFVGFAVAMSSDRIADKLPSLATGVLDMASRFMKGRK